MVNNLIRIRKELHKYAEISGKEEKTSKMIIAELKRFKPDKIITKIGGYGIAAIFNCFHKGSTIIIRAELDALPISESNNFSYRSINNGVSHKCGHDGHMTILIGLAEKISKNKHNLRGKIILLFQPAEEIAAGAKLILSEQKFKTLKPDYIIALHNLPGFKKGMIILKAGIFAAASKGVIIDLFGEPSHAGYPENGNSPTLAMTNIINGLQNIPQIYTSMHNAALITIIHTNLGKRAFGTLPDHAQIMATFRSHRDKEMNKMTEKSIEIIKGISNTYDLKYKIEWVEPFLATVNNKKCVKKIESAANQINKDVFYIKQPFPWSEDFSYFSQNYKSALFGLGSGLNHSQLHTANYDFPDEIISDGIEIFYSIIKTIK